MILLQKKKNKDFKILNLTDPHITCEKDGEKLVTTYKISAFHSVEELKIKGSVIWNAFKETTVINCINN